MKSPAGEKLVKCPICNEKYLERSLKLHIICTATRETFRRMNIFLDYAKNKPQNISPMVMISNMPHLRLYRRNLKNKLIFQL